MRARIPSKYSFDTFKVAQAISDVLAANALNPLCTVHGNGKVEISEATLTTEVRTQIKNAVLPLLTDTSADPDITV